MPKRHDHPYAAGNPGSWSIGSDSLTVAGRSEMLRGLGRQLQNAYGDVLKEPTPDPIKHLLEKLERSHRPDDDGSR